MASKKCPKCGEDNPAEAVMCWACYTPLSGSAPLGAGLAGGVATAGAMPKTAGAPIGIPQTEAPAKKGIDPKVIGVGAFLLVAVVAAIFMSGALGGKPTVEMGTTFVPQEDFVPSTNGGAPPSSVTVPTLGTGSGTGSAPPAPVPQAFTTIASPSAKWNTGTLGILLTGNSSPAGAAKFAKDQFARNGNWANMQVAVFTDKATADSFAKYQSSHNNEPLAGGKFQELANQGIWANMPAFLDARGKQEKMYYPARSPGTFPGR